MYRVAVLALVAACGGHRHGPPRDDDPHRLYVEVAADGSHRTALRDGAAQGLANISFAVASPGNGDIELQAEVSRLDRIGNTTEYRVVHPRWNVWTPIDVTLHCHAATVYGPGFADSLAQPPHSGLFADGSDVAVYPAASITR